jgi:DNA polymerase-3 subunit chi
MGLDHSLLDGLVYGPDTMTEVLFYHLERASAGDVLPVLLLKTLERGWRAVVQVGSDDHLADLSTMLWSFRDDEFLPHGSADDGFAEHQPVWLTSGDDAPNGATVRFLIEGADCTDTNGLDRLIVMFEGRDEDALARARQKWKDVCATPGLTATYWQQDERGRWVKRAEGGQAGTQQGNDSDER